MDKKDNSDFFYRSKLNGLKTDEYTTPHALPLLILYIDYIKNNRCKGRRDLFNLYFDQLTRGTTRIKPLLRSLCERTKGVKICRLIGQLKMIKSKSSSSENTNLTFLNLFFYEFTGKTHFKNKFFYENRKFIDPSDGDHYWYDNYPVKKNKKELSVFLKKLKNDKRQCIETFDRVFIHKTNSVFESKLRLLSNLVLDTKDHDLINDLNWKRATKGDIFKGLYEELFPVWGKRLITKYYLKEANDFCKIEDHDFCDHKSSYICFFRDLKRKNTCTKFPLNNELLPESM